jgi:hypothetical protein
LQDVIGAALCLSKLSFAVFCVAVAGKLLIEFYQQRGAPQAGPLNQQDVPAWADALARLVEALTKANPALLALLASFTFMAIAYLAASPIQPPENPSPGESRQTSAEKPNDGKGARPPDAK